MTEPRVTVVSVTRERFSPTQRSIDSVYADASVPFEMVVVDGGSPARVRKALERDARARGYEIVRSDRALSPNEARNRGLERVGTEFVVFLDNDVVVSPGWLGKLLECADETGAEVIGPLTCIGEPLGERIHFAGGEVHVDEERDGDTVTRHVRERMWLPNQRVAKVHDQLRRRQCELAEFHCVMARTDLFERIGPFDEEMYNTREHLDFCMEVAKVGGKVYVEPDSVVTYIQQTPRRPSDVAFFMLRWSDDWERRSLLRFREKWDLADDDFFQRRLQALGWRRTVILRELSKTITFGRGSHKIATVMQIPERRLNRLITDRHARRRGRAAA